MRLVSSAPLRKWRSHIPYSSACTSVYEGILLLFTRQYRVVCATIIVANLGETHWHLAGKRLKNLRLRLHFGSGPQLRFERSLLLLNRHLHKVPVSTIICRIRVLFKFGGMLDC